MWHWPRKSGCAKVSFIISSNTWGTHRHCWPTRCLCGWATSNFAPTACYTTVTFGPRWSSNTRPQRFPLHNEFSSKSQLTTFCFTWTISSFQTAWTTIAAKWIIIIKNVYTWITSQDTKKSDKSHKRNAFQEATNSSNARDRMRFVEQRKKLFLRSKNAFWSSFKPLQTFLWRVPTSDFIPSNRWFMPSNGGLYAVQREALCPTSGTFLAFLERFCAQTRKLRGFMCLQSGFNRTSSAA